MNKKVYQKPAMRVVRIQHQSQILALSDVVTTVESSSDTGLGYGGGSSEPARSRSFDGWDDDWNE